MPAMLRNPIIWRQWRVWSRRGKLWGILLANFAALLLAVLYIHLAQDPSRPGRTWQQMCLRFTQFVIAVQIFIAFYVSLGMTLDSLSHEKRGNTHEFLVMLPISAAGKTVGLWLGHNLLPLLLVVLMTPIGVVCGLIGGIEAGRLIWLYVLIYVGFCAYSLAGLAVSNALGSQRGAWIVVLLVFIVGTPIAGTAAERRFTMVPLMVFGPYSFLAAATSRPGEVADILAGGRYHFYSLNVPWQLCPLVLFGFMALFCFLVARRRLSRPSGPPVHRLLILVAFCILQVLLVGFLADSFTGFSPCATTALYFNLFFGGILVWGITATPNYASLMQWVQHRPHWAIRLVTDSFRSVHAPAFLPMLALWAVTTATVICIDQLYLYALSPWRLLAVAAVIGMPR